MNKSDREEIFLTRARTVEKRRKKEEAREREESFYICSSKQTKKIDPPKSRV